MTVLDQQVHHLSPAARDRLAGEAHELDTRRAELVAQQGVETGGDLIDQASTASLQIEIEAIDRRLARIRELLVSADESAEEDVAPADADAVSIGSIVTLRFDDGSTETYHVGLIEEQDDDIVALTPTSPLGRAILGQRVGASVTYDAPAGQLTIEIVEVAAS